MRLLNVNYLDSMKHLFVKRIYHRRFSDIEACIGVLGIQDICHFTSRDIGYYPFYFQGYGILGSIFSLLPGILKN